MRPHHFPPQQTVYKYSRKQQRKGIWQAIHDALRGEFCEGLGREANFSIAIGDSHSVKTPGN